jgi:hypothetical protein
VTELNAYGLKRHIHLKRCPQIGSSYSLSYVQFNLEAKFDRLHYTFQGQLMSLTGNKYGCHENGSS